MADLLFVGTAVLYLISCLGYIIFLVSRKKAVAYFSLYVTLLGFIVHSIWLYLRFRAANYIPLSNLYESVSFFAWATILIYLILELRHWLPVAGVFVLPIAFLLVCFGLLLDKEIKPLMPALQSFWLGLHASACFLGYASFAVAFSIGLMHILQERQLKSKRLGAIFLRLPSLDILDKLEYRTIGFGFTMLTLGIISGSVWAQSAWGRYWSWDPKETWSLITWFIYAIYLHARLVSGWRGRKAAYLVVIGFLVVLFTYLGTSFLLPGLHSYL